ncbi:hypothetical protein CXF85_02765 [Colwellia sp. 75C3]|nr:hypothetical protein CXF85_02765 [Colwellia sp. 75C3]
MWWIIGVTIFLTICSAWYISHELNLVWEPTKVSSYKNLRVYFFPSITIASIGMTILGLYVVYFKISQTAIQIENTNTQIKDSQKQILLSEQRRISDAALAEDRHRSEVIMSEINNTCVQIDNLFNEVEETPKEFIILIANGLMDSIKKEGNQVLNYRQDISNKQVIFNLSKGEPMHSKWESPMFNLNVFVKNHHPEKIKKLYKETYPENNKIPHFNIAAQLKILVEYSWELADIDSARHNIISKKLSRYTLFASLLNKVELFDEQFMELFTLLNSLAYNSRSLGIDLLAKFSIEINQSNLIEGDINKGMLSNHSMEKIESDGVFHTKHFVDIANQKLEREFGSWKICS